MFDKKGQWRSHTARAASRFIARFRCQEPLAAHAVFCRRLHAPVYTHFFHTHSANMYSYTHQHVYLIYACIHTRFRSKSFVSSQMSNCATSSFFAFDFSDSLTFSFVYNFEICARCSHRQLDDENCRDYVREALITQSGV